MQVWCTFPSLLVVDHGYVSSMLHLRVDRMRSSLRCRTDRCNILRAHARFRDNEAWPSQVFIRTRHGLSFRALGIPACARVHGCTGRAEGAARGCFIYACQHGPHWHDMPLGSVLDPGNESHGRADRRAHERTRDCGRAPMHDCAFTRPGIGYRHPRVCARCPSRRGNNRNSSAGKTATVACAALLGRWPYTTYVCGLLVHDMSVGSRVQGIP